MFEFGAPVAFCCGTYVSRKKQVSDLLVLTRVKPVPTTCMRRSKDTNGPYITPKYRKIILLLCKKSSTNVSTPMYRNNIYPKNTFNRGDRCFTSNRTLVKSFVGCDTMCDSPFHSWILLPCIPSSISFHDTTHPHNTMEYH